MATSRSEQRLPKASSTSSFSFLGSARTSAARSGRQGLVASRRRLERAGCLQSGDCRLHDFVAAGMFPPTSARCPTSKSIGIALEATSGHKQNLSPRTKRSSRLTKSQGRKVSLCPVRVRFPCLQCIVRQCGLVYGQTGRVFPEVRARISRLLRQINDPAAGGTPRFHRSGDDRANFANDRIIEIGFVEVDKVKAWGVELTSSIPMLRSRHSSPV